MTQALDNPRLKRATLEMSLKPFKSLEPDYIENICAEALEQWKPLLAMSKSASLLLWISDGSEILTWDGKEDTEFEWAKYIGFANEHCFSHIQDEENPRIARLYTDNPVTMTYGDLKTIIAIFKRIAEQRFGISLEVGAAFDAGPEFAYSDFKYKTHPEINRAELSGKYISLKSDYTVVCTWSKLTEDCNSYAGYPSGIPEGTLFGQFLGRQCASYLPALGFDYIWFSNGFALSYFPWTYLGANYDGTTLPLADYSELSAKVMLFWDEFKRECPGYRIEIRGTNFGTAMDLAKDHVPMKELYDKGYIEYPAPNSPWGALNFDFGLEMTGYMSRIAELPGDTYPYRFYPNDPWFWQNPWQDLYDREPHDIYCPLAVARVNEQGELEGPGIVEILTIDTEKGELNAATSAEVISHINGALQHSPDHPGLMTWLYPFRELHDAAAQSNEHSGALLFHDWFVRCAINEGLPLNTVVGTDVFFAMDDTAQSKLKETILLIAAFWLTEEKAEQIGAYVKAGGKVLLYGDVKDPQLLQLLGLAKAEPLEGEFDVKLMVVQDGFESAGSPARLNHRSSIGNGGLSDQLADRSDPYTFVAAEAVQEGESRVFALSRALPEWKGGRAGWVRGSLPFEASGITNLPVMQNKVNWLDSSVLLRYMLQHFDYTILQQKFNASTASGLMFVKRHDNAFFFTGCKKDSLVSFSMSFPEGEPVIIGQTAVVGRGLSAFALERTFHDECRAFVKQQSVTQVWCREHSPLPTHKKQSVRQFAIGGLIDAELTLYPPIAAMETGLFELRAGHAEGKAIAYERRGDKVVATGVNGTVSVTW